MIWSLISSPASSILTETEAKIYLRVDSDFVDDDAAINSMLDGARVWIENETGLAIGSQTREVAFRRWPASYDVSLPGSPLQSVTSVVYGSGDTVLDPLIYTTTIERSREGRLHLLQGESWPTDSLVDGSLRIRYVCGYTSLSDLPADLLIAWRLLLGHAYENREAVLASSERRAEAAVVPLGVQEILDRYRIY